MMENNMFKTEEDRLVSCSSVCAEEIVVPEGIRVIEIAAFYAMRHLRRMILPESLEVIEKFAFCECTHLEEIYLGKQVRFIARDAFDACSRLTGIFVSKDNPCFSSENGILFDKKRETLLRFPENSPLAEGTFLIPSYVRHIGENAFNRVRRLKKVVFHNKVETIGYKAFCYANGISCFELPSSLHEIGYAAFSNCSSLSGFTLQGPSDYFCINEGCLYTKNMTELIQRPCALDSPVMVIPNEVVKIRDRALTSGTCLQAFHQDDGGCFRIRDGVLFSEEGGVLLAYPSGRKDRSYRIPEGVRMIIGSAFQNSRYLEDVSLNSDLVKISRHAFESCQLRKIYGSSSLAHIGWGSFMHCRNLVEADFSGSPLRKINGCAFMDCTGLQKVLLPDTVREIVPWAFTGCDSLHEITMTGGIGEKLRFGLDFPL